MDAYTDLLIALRQILRATDLQSKRLAREAGVSTAQLLTMQVIDEEPGIAVGAVAKSLNLTQATTTAVVKSLEERGLVRRKRDTQDRRRVLVSLTAAGRRALKRAPQALQDVLRQRFELLEGWEQLALVASLQRLAAMMDAQSLDAAPVLEPGQLQHAVLPAAEA